MHTTPIKDIQQAAFDAMVRKVGKDDLYWVQCLFEHHLASKARFDVQEGILEKRYTDSTQTVQHILHERGVYDYQFPGILAQLFSTKIPEDQSLFLLGPQINEKSPLEIICVTPKICSRDYEEFVVLKGVDEIASETMKGKHKSVTGELKVPQTNWARYPRIMKKSFGPTVEPSADFTKDIQDLMTCTGFYQQFQAYQTQKDESFRRTAEKIIGY